MSQAERGSLGALSVLLFRISAVSKQHLRQIGVQQPHHHLSEFVMLDRLCDIVVEARSCRVVDLISHGIGGQCHNGNLREVVLCLPSPDLTTSIVPILHRHLDITLSRSYKLVSV